MRIELSHSPGTEFDFKAPWHNRTLIDFCGGIIRTHQLDDKLLVGLRRQCAEVHRAQFMCGKFAQIEPQYRIGIFAIDGVLKTAPFLLKMILAAFD